MFGGGNGLPAESGLTGATIAVQDVQTWLQPAAQLAIEARQADNWSARQAGGVGIVCCLGVGLGFVEQLPQF